MSRIGNKAVPVPEGVEVEIEGRRVAVKGPKGALSQELTGTVAAELLSDPPRVVIRRGTDQRTERALHGLYRALIANMVTGVTEGFRKEQASQEEVPTETEDLLDTEAGDSPGRPAHRQLLQRRRAGTGAGD